MTVLIIGLRWPPETFIERRIEGLLRAGLEVVVAASSIEAAPGRHPNLKLVRIPNWRGAWPVRVLRLGGLLAGALLRSPAGTARIVRYARRSSRRPADIAQCLTRLLPFAGIRAGLAHFEWNLAAVDFLPLFDLLDCPAVVSCRGSQIQVAPHNPERRPVTSRIRETFEKSSAVHCVSERILEEAKGLGLDSSKAVVIRPAVDPEFFTPPLARDRNDGQFRIVSVGSLNWVKGYEYALMAVHSLVGLGLDVRYEIIGEGAKSERQRVVFTIEDLGLRTVVMLSGGKRPEEIRAALRDADVFLLPSLSEGISNAALEAMSCGLPVVSSDCGGMREAISHGVEGYLTAPRDAGCMARHLALLASDAESRRAMGAAARQRVIREFSLAGQSGRFVELYTSLARRQGEPAGEPARMQQELL